MTELFFDRILPNWGVFSAIPFAFFTVFLSLIFVTPLQFRLAKVKNGLAPLRITLLAFGVSFIITNTITLFLLSQVAWRFLHTDTNATLAGNALIFTFGFFSLVKSILGLVMYRFKFTPDEILYHDRLAQMEKTAKRKMDLTKKSKRDKK